MPDTPLLLAFDTSAAHCAAALLSGEEVLGQHFENRARGQAEALFPALEQLLQSANRGFNDLTAIGVGTGPGNFTGLRIAVSAARGLALSLKIPAIGITAFETAQALFTDTPNQILLPAPRGSAYRAAVKSDGTLSAPDMLENAPPDALCCLDWSGAAMIAMARRAQTRLATGRIFPRPAPLYVKPADAAPARDTAPRILS